MEGKIIRLDHQGQGIALIDNKVTFVPKTIPNDQGEIIITKVKKNYQEARLVKIIKPAPNRVESFCPYYTLCGGCQLQNFTYNETIEYKLNRVKNILSQVKIMMPIEVINNPQPRNYRNKIELKVRNGQIGFYEIKSNKIVPLKNCPITDAKINQILPYLDRLEIKEGDITLRSNLKGDVLVIISTKERIKWQAFLKNVSVQGLIYNQKLLYGSDYLEEEINNLKYKINYDAFFQVNPYVASKLFNLVNANIAPHAKVLDLYCGVGTLSLTSALKAKEVLGIEIVANAITNARANALINNLLQVSFQTGNVEKIITKLDHDFDTWIIDPPRQGILSKTRQIIMQKLPSKIIYISCDTLTFARDLAILKAEYHLKKIYILDMFSYTYHTEHLAILERKCLNKIK